MKYFCKIFVLIIISCFALQAQSGLQELKFSRLTTRQGLSQNSVNCVIQDRTGVLWFGTTNGLNRYDGYSFKKYRHEPNNANSLSHNYILYLYEDKAGYIWVVTFNGGLNRFDPKTDNVVRYVHDKNVPGSIPTNDVRSVYEDSEGKIWVGTYIKGLTWLDVKTQKFTTIDESYIPRGLRPYSVFCIANDYNKGLWVGTIAGLFFFDKKQQKYTKHFDPLSFGKGIKATGWKMGIHQIHRDKKEPNILWLTTYASGLLRFNTKTEKLEDHFVHDPANPHSVSNNATWSFCQGNNGAYWVGSGNGLHRLDYATKKFTRFRHDRQKLTSLGGNNIQQIFQDRAGTIWLCTYDGGISYFTPHLNRFLHYNNFGNKDNRRVQALCEDKDGNIYIGLRKGNAGLAILNRKDNSIKTFSSNSNNPQTLGSNEINKLLIGKKGGLWLGTIGNGVNHYNTKTKLFKRLPYNPKRYDILRSPHVGALFQDKPGMLWVGSRGMGLHKINAKKWKSDMYWDAYRLVRKTTISHNTIVAVTKDYKENMWVGTRNGLNKIDHITGEVVQYHHVPGKLNSLSNNHISFLHLDANSVLWIGTRQGLNCLNLRELYRGQGHFKRYTAEDGLANEVIQTIVEDRQGYLWLSTGKGLSCFDPKTETFKNYDESDGLQGNEFMTGSGLLARDGAIIMGGLNGLNLFYPEKVQSNTYKPKVLITDFQIFNKSVPVTKDGILTRPVWATDTIHLSYKDNVVSFEFAALNYIQSKKNTYKIKMEGFDKNWRSIGVKRFDTYTNLSPGTYIFRVKAANNDGVWSDKETWLVLVVHPPFWKTITFYILLVLLLTFLVLGVIRWRTNNLKKQKRVLEHKVEERTQEIKIQAEEIIAQAEELKKINEQLVELDDFKQGVTGMIVHDLKNPLNTLMAYAKSPELKQSARQMNHMVLNILDVQKLELAELKLHWDIFSFQAIVEEAVYQIKVLSLQKNLYIKRVCDIDYRVKADKDITTRIMVNLLTNAIKHAPLNSGIEISIEQLSPAWIKVLVTDEGEGVPPDLQEKVFDKFFSMTAKNTQSIKPTGLGLAFCKLAVEAHQGSIGVTNVPDKGACFWFTLPLVDLTLLSDPVIPRNILDHLNLSDKDKACLYWVVEALMQIEVYEMGKIKKMVDSINDVEHSNVKKWKELVLDATFSMNQVLYNELMQLVVNKQSQA